MLTDQLEAEIKAVGDTVVALYDIARSTENPQLASDLRSQARQSAAQMARLVAMRSSETIKAMERERGLV